MIVDCMNLFVRSYSAYPSMSSHGYQMGGAVGFMKTLSRIVGESHPSAVYLAWEGGGSTKRRALYPEYKMNRKPERLNRFYGDDIPDSDDNKKHQIIALLSMLKCAPVCQVYVGDAEGDDIIAYLCKGPFKDIPKIIVSSDKDMYQLLDDDTMAYSLHRKLYIKPEDVLKEFRTTAHNFALAKALCGDVSDNIPGIKGLGFKKVIKLFPFLGSEDHVILQDIFDYCHTHVDESMIYKRVLESEKDIRRNWRLIYLDDNSLSATQSARVDHVIGTFKPQCDRMGLMKCLIKEGINDFDVEYFFFSFNGIEGMKYSTDNVKIEEKE